MASSERFGYEWDTYPHLMEGYEEQFLKWVHPLTKDDFKGKSVLDAGCGMGRNSYWPLQYGASHVTAFDKDPRSVAAAKKLLEKYPHATVMEGDIYSLNPGRQFDIVFSIGVIHHLKEPRAALTHLASLVKPGGTLLIWVYGYEGNEWIVKMVNPIRKLITSKLPVTLTHALSYLASVPLFLFVKCVRQKNSYQAQLGKFGFHHIHSIVFDQLIPEIAHYWKKDEATALLSNIPGFFEPQIFHTNQMSWTVITKRN